MKLEYKEAQKLEKNCSYHISSMTLGIHTNTCTTWYSLQRLFIHNENTVLLQCKQLFNPTVTRLEEENCALFITKTETLAQRGRNSQGERDCSYMRSQAELDLSLTESDLSLTKSNLSLTEYN